MKLSNSYKMIIAFGAVLSIVLFNIYIYRNEFIVQSDPNDNIFQYALIDEAKTNWKNIFSGKLPITYLFDSWNNRWTEGFPISFYYPHLPQAVISFISFFVPTNTFQLFIIIRTLLFVLLPLSFFLAMLILDFPVLFGIIVAFFSQAIFTDGLYGIDSSSFLWRGWGLSAELFALFFLPLAFAYALNYLINKKNLGRAIIFNFILAEAHLGIFSLVLFSYAFLGIFYISEWKQFVKRILLLLIPVGAGLAYFVIPFFLNGQYRNFSVWDPIWKFDSWGVKQISIWFLNGDLFDFKRFPFITLTIVCGIFVGLAHKKNIVRYFAGLFLIYLVLFFGRTSLGKIIDLVPGFSEYHLHRIVVMVQFGGVLIGSWFVYQTLEILFSERLHKYKKIILIGCIVAGPLLIYKMEQPVVKYAEDNNQMITNGNNLYENDLGSYLKIVSVLRKLPKAGIYAGRPGNWGKTLLIGPTQVYMALSRDGFSINGFLPESWSPNSDPEQFFDENNQVFYRLYNIRYIVYPEDKKAPDFAKLIIKSGKLALYQVDTDGWFGLGRSSSLVIAKKTNLLTAVRMWFESKMFKNNDYPTISLNGSVTEKPKTIQITGMNTYYDKSAFFSKTQSFFEVNPFSLIDSGTLPVLHNKQETVLANGYKTSFRLDDSCSQCILVLRQSFHPGWKVTVNGTEIKTFPVFPFYIGVPLQAKGDYKIVAQYGSTTLKILLTLGEALLVIGTSALFLYMKKHKKAGLS